MSLHLSSPSPAIIEAEIIELQPTVTMADAPEFGVIFAENIPDQTVDHALGEARPGPFRILHKCVSCAVHWNSEVELDNCWSCNELVPRYVEKYQYQEAKPHSLQDKARAAANWMLLKLFRFAA